MKLLYVDESGDPGKYNSPTRYFILSAILVDDFNWHQLLSEHIHFREYLRDSKGLKLAEEIHASEFINSPGELVRIKKNNRLDILKKTIDWVANHNLDIITIAVDKQGNEKDIFKYAWKTLLIRFENVLANEGNNGMIITDNTDGNKLREIMRELSLKYIIEDPVLKHSYNSYFIQIVDVIVYFARQLYEPNNYVRKKGGHNFYKRL
ncbi:DUF3800 domain-containing protein [Halocella sp. SP3-1]|uniref:DUF3800 domain-containing protein n=1 Tax=Halocella sp. SP3-1 TaxID=2382161 RepID=UPI000F758518|nr:DUF3800 domain-containing protein [Halocella sp. SP3-1]AZO96394.1 DUF3800 domain-containing protein [Halocella sp. SP3-1]